MKKIITAEMAEGFAKVSRDENCLHSNSEMWQCYGVPALVPGMQTLCTALASIDPNEITGLNYVRANFQRMIPVGSEVEFTNEPIKRGFWKGILEKLLSEDATARDIKILAIANGFDTLEGKDEHSLATRVVLNTKPYFNEGDVPVNLAVNPLDVEKFAELTELPREAVSALYALSLSSSSIASRIMHPSAPSWQELHDSLAASVERRKIPAYESIEAYFPGGFKQYKLEKGLVLRSAIRKEGNVYVIDTICDTEDERIYGVRANLKQRRQEVIVKGICALLDDLDEKGNAGALAESIQRRKEFLAQISSSQPHQAA